MLYAIGGIRHSREYYKDFEVLNVRNVKHVLDEDGILGGADAWVILPIDDSKYPSYYSGIRMAWTCEYDTGRSFIILGGERTSLSNAEGAMRALEIGIDGVQESKIQFWQHRHMIAQQGGHQCFRLTNREVITFDPFPYRSNKLEHFQRFSIKPGEVSLGFNSINCLDRD